MEINATILNTLSFEEFTDNVEYIWKTHMDMVVPVARQLYNLEPDTGVGTVKEYAEYDSETFADDMAEGSDASKARVGTGYKITVNMERFGKEIDITQVMRMRADVGKVISRLTALRHFIPQREELDLTHRLTFGTSTSYTNKNGRSVDVAMGDGFALFYSAHTLAHSSDTYRNRISGDPLFSAGGLNAALKLGSTNILSNFGEKRVMNFTHVWFGDDPDTEHEVMIVLKSTSDTTQNNSGVINPHMGRLLPLKLPYLATTATGAYDSTKAKWWGIVAAGQGEMGWQAYYCIAEPANMKPAYQDPHNDNWTYGARSSRFIGIVSGRGNIASCPVS